MKRQLFAAAGLAAAGVVAYLVATLDGQGADAARDFTRAAVAEVRDAQGQVLLRGTFVPSDDDDDDLELRASLEAVGVDGDAAGRAEVEFERSAPVDQEIEFRVWNLEPGLAVSFVIDETVVATVTTDRRGRAGVEIESGPYK